MSVEVKKSQHRYLVGTHSNGLHEFFQKTDVWIKVPPADVPSETITLFGAQDKLGAALTVLYSKVRILPCAVSCQWGGMAGAWPNRMPEPASMRWIAGGSCVGRLEEVFGAGVMEKRR